MNEINTARRLREAATEKAEAERIMKVLDCLESPLALHCSGPALLTPQFALTSVHRQATICRIGNRWSVPAASRHLRTCACDMHVCAYELAYARASPDDLAPQTRDCWEFLSRSTSSSTRPLLVHGRFLQVKAAEADALAMEWEGRGIAAERRAIVDGTARSVLTAWKSAP